MYLIHDILGNLTLVLADGYGHEGRLGRFDDGTEGLIAGVSVDCVSLAE